MKRRPLHRANSSYKLQEIPLLIRVVNEIVFARKLRNSAGIGRYRTTDRLLARTQASSGTDTDHSARYCHLQARDAACGLLRVQCVQSSTLQGQGHTSQDISEHSLTIASRITTPDLSLIYRIYRELYNSASDLHRVICYPHVSISRKISTRPDVYASCLALL